MELHATRHTKQIWLRLLLGLIALVAVFIAATAIYLLTQRIAAGNQLRATERELTAAGFLKPLDELSPPPSREAVANGQAYLGAISGISALTKADPSVTQGPDIMPISSPGLATPAAQASAPVFPPSEKTTPPATWDELRTRLAPAQPIFAEAHRLLQNPASYDYDHTTPKSLIPAEHSQNLIAWLRASALLHIHDGNLPAAIDDMQTIAQSSIFVGSRPSLISYALSVGLWQYGLNGLFWEILQAPDLTDADLIRLDQIARSGPSVSRVMLALEVESSVVPYWIDHVKATLPEVSPLVFGQADDSLLGSALAINIRAALWRYVWADQDEALTIANWCRDVKNVRQIIDAKNLHVSPYLALENDTPDPSADWRHPYYAMFEGSRAARGTIKTAVKFETTRQLILTAIALQRYRLRTGQYPTTLAALIPDYLPELPNDWYDGQPLKYRYPATPNTYLILDRPAEYLLYSVGTDGQDQGGDPTPAEATKKPTIHKGRDILWPH